MLTPISTPNRCPGLTLVAWAKATWNGAAWVLVSGAGLTIGGANAFDVQCTFPVAQADVNYVVDAITSTMASYPVALGIYTRSVNGFYIRQSTNGGAANANSGDQVYIGVYR